MSLKEPFKLLMKSYGITYADIGAKVNRSPWTAKQRIETDSTFHNYIDEYTKALDDCIKDKELLQKEAREKLNGINE